MNLHIVSLIMVLLVPLINGCDKHGKPPSFTIDLRQPILETMVVDKKLIPQHADGTFPALPNQKPIRLRVQADMLPSISVNGTPLSSRKAEGEEVPWFEAHGVALAHGARSLFYNILISLPPALRVAGPGVVTITLDYRGLRADIKIPEPLTIPLISSYREVGWPPVPPRPSQIFWTGDNSKPDNRAADAIVARCSPGRMAFRGKPFYSFA